MKPAVLPAALLLLAPLSAAAVTRTWDGGGGTALFSTAANWDPDGAPASGDALVFPAAAPNTVTNDLTSRTFVTLSFPAGTTIAGNGFTLTSGISTSSMGIRGAVTIEANVTLGADQTFTAGGTGSLVFAGNVNFGARKLTVAGTRPVVFQGITGSSTAGSQLRKTGPGMLRIDPSAIVITNLPFTLTEGTLDVDGNFQVPVTMTGGTLTGEGTLGFAFDATGGDIIPDDDDLTISGAASLGGTARLKVRLPGPSDETGLDCNGSLTITGDAALDVDTGGLNPARGEVFQFITKSSGAISGFFSNAPPGTEYPAGTSVLRLSYTGGNGNDVTLATVSTTRTWDEGATLNNNWTSADNWSQNLAPQSGDVLVFPFLSHDIRSVDNNFANYTTFRQLVVESFYYKFRGAPFALSHGVIAETDLDFDTSVRLAQDQEWQLGAQIGGTFQLATVHFDLLDELETNGRILTVRGSAELDGKMTGSGGLTVREDSFFDLLKANTFTGPVVVEAGAHLHIRDHESLGTTQGNTTVEGELSIGGFGNDAIAEPFVLRGGSRVELGQDTVLTGPIVLTPGSSGVAIEGSAGSQRLLGQITSTAEITANLSKVEIGGTAANTWQGGAIINGPVVLNKTAGRNALSCRRVLINDFSSDTVLLCHQNEQIADDAEVELDSLFLLGLVSPPGAGTTETLGTLILEGDTGGSPLVDGPPGAQLILTTALESGGTDAVARIKTPLRVTGNPVTFTIADRPQETDLEITGALTRTGAGRIVKAGAGTLLLTGSAAVPLELTGGVTVFTGHAAASAIALHGGTLAGSGSVGNVTALTGGGTVSPGPNLAILNTGSLTWNAATRLRIEAGVFNLGTGYDRLAAAGSVTLNGATLEVVRLPSFGVPAGAQLLIVSNGGAAAVSGTFAGLPQGAFLPDPAGAAGFTISYTGGDGNDVVLTRVSFAPVTPLLTSMTLAQGAGPGGQDQVILAGTAGPSQTVTLEVSPNLSVWTTLQSVTANAAGNVAVTLHQTAGIQRRFFRLMP